MTTFWQRLMVAAGLVCQVLKLGDAVPCTKRLDLTGHKAWAEAKSGCPESVRAFAGHHTGKSAQVVTFRYARLSAIDALRSFYWLVLTG